MASLGAIESELNGVPTDIRTRLVSAFREVLRMRVGRPDVTKAVRAENFSGGLVPGRTAASAGDEFSIEHGLGRVPYVVDLKLPLVVNMQTVQLIVSRAPDDRRCYFTSPDEDAPFLVYVE